MYTVYVEITVLDFIMKLQVCFPQLCKVMLLIHDVLSSIIQSSNNNPVYFMIYQNVLLNLQHLQKYFVNVLPRLFIVPFIFI